MESHPLFTSVPRRRSTARLRTELITTIESIPAYIERCSVFIIFAPTCVPGALAAGSQFLPESMVAWRRRGWTRAEFLLGWLSPRNLVRMHYSSREGLTPDGWGSPEANLTSPSPLGYRKGALTFHEWSVRLLLTL